MKGKGKEKTKRRIRNEKEKRKNRKRKSNKITRKNMSKNKKQNKKRNKKKEKKQKNKKVKYSRQETINFSSCVDIMKNFTSRIKKAFNVERQAKRIETFKTITEKKILKVFT